MSQQDFWKDNLWPLDPATGERPITFPGGSAMTIPIGTTAERPSSPVNGMFRYNTDFGDFEVYNGGWAFVSTIGGGVSLSKLEDADNDTEIFVENYFGVDDDSIVFTLGDNSGTYSVPSEILNWSTGGFSIETPTGTASNAGVAFSVTTGGGHALQAGGAISFTAGDGGANGDGGSISLTSGDAGASAGVGGGLSLAAGNSPVDAGGDVTIAAGTSGVGFAGGDVVISGGDTTNAAGGAISLNGGDVVGGAGVGGQVIIAPGTSLGAVGANISLTAGDGDGGTNKGGDVLVTAGTGESAGGAGGDLTFTAGPGGAGLGNGGDITLLSGAPGATGTSGSINIECEDSAGAFPGGVVTVVAGDGGSIGAGGAISLTAGAGGSTSGVGGNLNLTAGPGGTGDFGGNVVITAGDGNGSSDGGNVTVVTGDGGLGGGDFGGAFSLTTGDGAAGSGDITISTGVSAAGAGGDVSLVAGEGFTTDGVITLSTAGFERLRIEADGTLSVQGTTTYEALVTSDDDIPNKKYVDDAITGTVGMPTTGGTFTGDVIWDVGTQIFAPAGTSADPSIALATDTDTGIVFQSPGIIRFATGGVQRAKFEGTTFEIEVPLGGSNAGTAAAPSYTFQGDLDTGVYRIGADTLGISTFGTERLRVESDGTLSVQGTTDYELLVTDDDDIPNKAYVDSIPHPYDLQGFMTGLPAASPGDIVYRWVAPRPITISGGPHFAFADLSFLASVSPAAFDFVVSSPGGTAPGAPVGTLTFAVGTGTGVVTLGPLALGAGDELLLVYTTLDGGPSLDRVEVGLVGTTP